MKFAVMVCLGATALAGIGCADGRALPTNPSANSAPVSLAASAPGNDGSTPSSASPSLAAAPRSGELLVTKECSRFSTDSFCSILEPNVKAIEPGSRIVYLQPGDLFTPTGSDVVLDPPKPGNNAAFGHCSLALGKCEFSGGTGKFTTFQAQVDVTHEPDFSRWYWKGTYSFNSRD